jgi:hypothetical protein
MSRTSLVSVNVRREAREYLVGWTLREIGDLFHDHGFSADMTHDPQTSGERRTYVEQFYSVVDWSDRDQVERMLPVFEALLDDADSCEMTDANAASVMWSEKFARLLSRDGFDRDDIGRLRPRWVSLSAQVIDALPAESAIPMLLRRMWDNVEDNPDAAIGAAKEAIEATAKHILTAAGESIGEVEKMPGLIARSQETLGVHAKVVDSSKRASDSIKAILGSLSKVALGVNELRCDYGTGHGRPSRATGLNSRHARLAAQSADAWVRFMLDTAQARADELASQAS